MGKINTIRWQFEQAPAEQFGAEINNIPSAYSSYLAGQDEDLFKFPEKYIALALEADENKGNRQFARTSVVISYIRSRYSEKVVEWRNLQDAIKKSWSIFPKANVEKINRQQELERLWGPLYRVHNPYHEKPERRVYSRLFEGLQEWLDSNMSDLKKNKPYLATFGDWSQITSWQTTIDQAQNSLISRLKFLCGGNKNNVIDNNDAYTFGLIKVALSHQDTDFAQYLLTKMNELSLQRARVIYQYLAHHQLELSELEPEIGDKIQHTCDQNKLNALEFIDHHQYEAQPLTDLIESRLRAFNDKETIQILDQSIHSQTLQLLICKQFDNWFKDTFQKQIHSRQRLLSIWKAVDNNALKLADVLIDNYHSNNVLDSRLNNNRYEMYLFDEDDEVRDSEFALAKKAFSELLSKQAYDLANKLITRLAKFVSTEQKVILAREALNTSHYAMISTIFDNSAEHNSQQVVMTPQKLIDSAKLLNKLITNYYKNASSTSDLKEAILSAIDKLAEYIHTRTTLDQKLQMAVNALEKEKYLAVQKLFIPSAHNASEQPIMSQDQLNGYLDLLNNIITNYENTNSKSYGGETVLSAIDKLAEYIHTRTTFDQKLQMAVNALENEKYLAIQKLFAPSAYTSSKQLVMSEDQFNDYLDLYRKLFKLTQQRKAIMATYHLFKFMSHHTCESHKAYLADEVLDNSQNPYGIIIDMFSNDANYNSKSELIDEQAFGKLAAVVNKLLIYRQMDPNNQQCSQATDQLINYMMVRTEKSHQFHLALIVNSIDGESQTYNDIVNRIDQKPINFDEQSKKMAKQMLDKGANDLFNSLASCLDYGHVRQQISNPGDCDPDQLLNMAKIHILPLISEAVNKGAIEGAQTMLEKWYDEFEPSREQDKNDLIHKAKTQDSTGFNNYLKDKGYIKAENSDASSPGTPDSQAKASASTLRTYRDDLIHDARRHEAFQEEPYTGEYNQLTPQ